MRVLTGTTMRTMGIGGLFVLSLLLLSPAPGRASHEAFGVYETWDTPTIRSDRWLGAEDSGGQEVTRQVKGGRLWMRLRRQGQTDLGDGGGRTSSNILHFAKPLSVDQVEAEFKVNRLTVTSCEANPTPSTARPANLSLVPFNDGAGSPGNRTGDVFATIQARRTSSSADPSKVLRVFGSFGRCGDPTCSFAGFVTLSFAEVGQVTVGKPFALRIIWDAPNNQFLFGLNDNPDVALPYDPALNAAPAVLPLAFARILNSTANCTAGATVADADVSVFEVRTNTSAVIP